MEFFLGSAGSTEGGSTHVKQTMIGDGEWHVAVFDTQKLIDAKAYDGENVSFLRFDPVESGVLLDENGKTTQGLGSVVRNPGV